MRRRVSALLCAGLVLAGCGPLPPAPAPAVDPGAPLAGAPRSAVGLVVAGTPPDAARPARFSTTDWGLAWQDALERYAVPPDRLDPTTLRRQLEGRRVLVVTRAVEGLIGDSTVADLRRWVEAGASLVLEMPGPRWAQCAPAWVEGEARPAAGTLAQGDCGRAPAAGAGRPALTVRAPLVMRSGGDTLLWLDGEPAAAAFAVGRGQVIVLGMDFARWLVATQQGVPEDDFSVRADSPAGGDAEMLQADDLVAAPAPPRRLIPWSDRFQEALLGRAARGAGVARWRLLPDSARGVYLPSHDEEGVGDNWLYYGHHEARAGWTATWFVMSEGRLKGAGYRLLSTSPLEVGAHPDLRHEERAIPWRQAVRALLGRPRPGLGAQVDSVRARVRAAGRQAEVRLSRMHYLKWTRRYADRLLWLAHLGIRMDSSYGPDRKAFGYVFGTGLPFRPLDERGRPIPIWETPFQAMDDRAFAPQDVHALFEAAEGSGIGLIFHTTSMAYAPRADMIETYLSAPAWAGQRGFRTMSYGTLLDFWEARRARFAQAWRGDTLGVTLPESAAAPGLTLQLPLREGGRPLAAFRLGQGPWRAAPAERDSVAWREGEWLDLPAGAAAGGVQAVYGAQARPRGAPAVPAGAAPPRRGRRR